MSEPEWRRHPARSHGTCVDREKIIGGPMRTFSLTLTPYLFAAVFTPIVTAAVEASASTAGSARVYEPGIACRSTPNSGIGASYSSLGNWSGSTQTFWCPLWGTQSYGSASQAMATPANVYVDVTSGWASTSSCYTAFLISPSAGYWYNPVSVQHQSAGYD